MANSKNELLTFENDKLVNLKYFGEKLIEILKNADYYKKIPIYDPSQKAFTIAIDSKWGTGKTTFLKRLENQLNKDSNFNAIYYNAWECDDFGDALIPIVYQLKQILDKSIEGANDKIEKIEKLCNKFHVAAHYIGKVLSQTTINFNSPIGIGGEFPISAISDAVKDIIDKKPIWLDNDTFSEFENYINLREDFKKTVRTLVPQTGTKRVIIIDELDRCRPTFAVETLEVVKHLFDVENIQFIFAVDIEQLSHSIATMYGQNMDASGYLRRFFDLQLVFPAVNKLEFVKLQFEDDKALNSSINNIQEISATLQLTLRDIEKYTSYLKLLSKTSLKNCFEDVYSLEDLFAIYYYLIVLNSKYPDFWRFVQNYTGDSNLDNFKVAIGQSYTIPSRYFIDEKTPPKPQAVVDFCRNILLPSESKNRTLKDIYAHSTKYLNPDSLLSIGLRKSDRTFTVIQAIQNILAVLSIDIIKDN